eukprot:SAG11_NODE_40864_length_199_cov_44.320000_1_plen_25_part_10
MRYIQVEYRLAAGAVLLNGSTSSWE